VWQAGAADTSVRRLRPPATQTLGRLNLCWESGTLEIGISALLGVHYLSDL